LIFDMLAPLQIETTLKASRAAEAGYPPDAPGSSKLYEHRERDAE
jgi:hypothetical protein